MCDIKSTHPYIPHATPPVPLVICHVLCAHGPFPWPLGNPLIRASSQQSHKSAYQHKLIIRNSSCAYTTVTSLWTSHLFIYLFLTRAHQYCNRLFLIRTVPHSTHVVHFHRKGNIQIIEYFLDSYYFIFCDNLIIILRNKYTCMKILYVHVN